MLKEYFVFDNLILNQNNIIEQPFMMTKICNLYFFTAEGQTSVEKFQNYRVLLWDVQELIHTLCKGKVSQGKMFNKLREGHIFSKNIFPFSPVIIKKKHQKINFKFYLNIYFLHFKIFITILAINKICKQWLLSKTNKKHLWTNFIHFVNL